jgi:dimethylargininase
MSPHFRHAIVREPCRAMIHGLTTVNLGRPDYAEAMHQHRAYVEALRRCAVEVEILPPLEEYPDSVFVEDAALCTPRGALLTRPGALSRRGEPEHLADALRAHYGALARIEAPGTLDAGDVMMVGDVYYIGLSQRTNRAGADQLAAWLAQWGYRAELVPLSDGLHLKSDMAYLERNRLLTTPAFAEHPAFAGFERVIVDSAERYAANAVWVNERVLVARGYPGTTARLRKLGLDLIELDIGEYRKLDGGLSCLSLRF